MYSISVHLLCRYNYIYPVAVFPMDNKIDGVEAKLDSVNVSNETPDREQLKVGP